MIVDNHLSYQNNSIAMLWIYHIYLYIQLSDKPKSKDGIIKLEKIGEWIRIRFRLIHIWKSEKRQLDLQPFWFLQL